MIKKGRYKILDFTCGLNTLINTIDERYKDYKENPLENVGSMFQRGAFSEVINEYKRNTNNIDELLIELNNAGIGGGNLKIEDNIISGTYVKCYCPYRHALGDSISPGYCNCTKGWAKIIFEIILDRPVEVELVQAISRGDEVCKFVAKLI